MTSDIDYTAVDLPEEKPRTEYTYVERRAELLQRIQQAGHPRTLNQTEVADTYGVSQQQISQDLDRLAEHISANLGARRDLITEAVFHRAIAGLLEKEEYRKAAQTVKDWNDWLIEREDLRELDDRLAAIEETHQRAKYR